MKMGMVAKTISESRISICPLQMLLASWKMPSHRLERSVHHSSMLFTCMLKNSSCSNCYLISLQIAKDAKECVQECVSEFISFITSEASERCHQEKRKTINGEDILFAMSTLGFDMYVEPLKVYLQKFREVWFTCLSTHFTRVQCQGIDKVSCFLGNEGGEGHHNSASARRPERGTCRWQFW